MTGVTASMNQTYMLQIFSSHQCTTDSDLPKQARELQDLCIRICPYQQERSDCAIKDEQDATSKLQGYGNGEQVHILSLPYKLW